MACGLFYFLFLFSVSVQPRDVVENIFYRNERGMQKTKREIGDRMQIMLLISIRRPIIFANANPNMNLSFYGNSFDLSFDHRGVSCKNMSCRIWLIYTCRDAYLLRLVEPFCELSSLQIIFADYGGPIAIK